MPTKEDRITIRKRFIESFLTQLGDVADWEHTGNVIELDNPTGECVCGHPIKNLYEIKNAKTNNIRYLGSECIENFKEYSPSLYASLSQSLESFKEKKLEEKKREKEMMELEEVKHLSSILSEKVDQVSIIVENAKNRNSGWIPEAMYSAYRYNPFLGYKSPKKPYKRVSSLIKWLNIAIDANTKFIGRF